MADRWERVASAVLTVSALAIAIAVIRREFSGGGDPATPRREPEYVSSWQDIVAAGRTDGDEDARVKVIEFADLECPFCSKFHKTIQRITRDYPNDVAFVFVHFPLTNHRFARPAARAVECAHEVGRFRDLVNVIYEKQDSLGIRSWTSLAKDAGVENTTRFAKCVSDTLPVAAIEKGLAIGRKLEITATPTVFLNSWRLPSAPSDTLLVRAIQDILAGKRPYSRPGD